MPYQGGKWRVRHSLATLLASFGSIPVTDVVLADPGPWGLVLSTVLNPILRAEVVQKLVQMSQKDPWGVFQSLQGAPIPKDPVLFAAEFLFLQRLSFSGKAVGLYRDETWSSPGFNASSAYGLKGTIKFGEIHPMIPSLVRVLQSYDRDLVLPHFLQVLHEANHFDETLGKDTVVYLDPPYEHSTPYPNGSMTHAEVVDLATRWQSTGASVVVSESKPLQELVDQGWKTLRLHTGRTDTSPFKGKHEEWVTYFPPKSKS
jgi:site-specific DNA-adenine methylase